MITAQTSLGILGSQQGELALEYENEYLELLVTSSCPRHIWLMDYNRLVRLNKIAALEDMLHEDQKAVGEMAKDIAKGRLRRDALIELVKALLAIEYFLNLKKSSF